VDNINQPSLAAALTESLETGGKLQQMHWAPPIMVSAWLWIKDGCKAQGIHTLYSSSKGRNQAQLYTSTSGDIPVIVIEFLSDTEGVSIPISQVNGFFMSKS